MTTGDVHCTSGPGAARSGRPAKSSQTQLIWTVVRVAEPQKADGYTSVPDHVVRRDEPRTIGKPNKPSISLP